MASLQEGTKKECGLHSGNIADVSNGAEDTERDLWPQGAVEALSKERITELADGPRDKATLVVLYAPWCQFSKVKLPGSMEPGVRKTVLVLHAHTVLALQPHFMQKGTDTIIAIHVAECQAAILI